jgi:hypothetical protein
MSSYQRRGSVHRYTLFTTLSTTVDATSAASQKVLNVTATTSFAVGDVVLIDPDASGGGTETKTIASIQAGVSLTMTENLTYEHTAAQADIVLRQGVYMDVKHETLNTGTAGSGASEVCQLGYKSVAITLAAITAGNGFTLNLYGYINGQDQLLHSRAHTAVADIGSYVVTINVHCDDIKCTLTNYKDGTASVVMSGRPN